MRCHTYKYIRIRYLVPNKRLLFDKQNNLFILHRERTQNKRSALTYRNPDVDLLFLCV